MQTNAESHTTIHTNLRPAKEKTEPPESPRREKKGRRAPFSERLLRNTAVACALLLGILTLRNLDRPWSNAAVRGIESALTMRIDLDNSLGKLSFVRSIMPESSLVFLETGGVLTQPVSGDIEHAYTRAQPWTVYHCESGAPVRCVRSGTVSATAKMENGEWYVLVDHGKGLETLYAYLDKIDLKPGTEVKQGDVLGETAGEALYYEIRRDGESVDPGEDGI